MIHYIAGVGRDVSMSKLSTEEAIKILEDMKIDIPLPKAAVTQIKRNIALDMAVDVLSNCSEFPNNWIPNTKETVPKDPLRKQIQLKNGWIITGWFDGEDWFPVPEVGAGLLFDNVEAWCELPEPYQPESEEKHDT